jgi:hypothetical protein
MTMSPNGRAVTEPWFRVGQRVVCVDAAPNPKGYPLKVLKRGTIYTIRAIDATPRRWDAPGWGVHVEGILVMNPRRIEWAMNPGRFRPVVDRATDIEIFTKLLSGVP